MMGEVWFGGDSTTGQKHTSLSGQGFRLADLSGSPKFRGRARWQVPADQQELRRGEALAQVRALANAFLGLGLPRVGVDAGLSRSLYCWRVALVLRGSVASPCLFLTPRI